MRKTESKRSTFNSAKNKRRAKLVRAPPQNREIAENYPAFVSAM